MPVPIKVVDSWAMLAWIQNDPAAPAVEAFLRAADSGTIELCMSWINIAETFYILAKRHSPIAAEEFMTRLPSLPIRTVLANEESVMAAARIKAAYPLALGDAFAIALAKAERARLITGDPEIRRCGIVPVHWIA